MKVVTVFQSYITALAYIAGEYANHYFTATENRKWVEQAIEEMPQDVAYDAGVASTLIEYAANNNKVAGVSIDSEAHMGVILAHYSERGDIIRFVAIPA